MIQTASIARLRWPAALIMCLWVCTAHAGALLLDEVHTVAASGSAVPVEHAFTLTVSGTYHVTLVDEGQLLVPSAPMTSIALAVTSGSQVVAILNAAGSVQFNATAGDYVLHITGVPGPVAGSGLIGVQLTDPGNQVVAGYSDTLQPAASLPVNAGILNDSFTVPAPGNYTVTLSDMQFPQALAVASIALVQAGGPLITTLPGGPVVVSLADGVTYRIFGTGQLASGVTGGLYGVQVVPTGGGAAVYAHVVPVGAVTSIGSATLEAGSYQLAVADVGLPNPLAQAGAAVTAAGQVVALLSSTGNQSFSAVPDAYQVFGFGTAGAGPGSYAVDVTSSAGTKALSAARAVVSPASTDVAFSFDTSVTTAGTYNLDLADFSYPAALNTLSVIAVQNAVALTSPPLTIGSSIANSPATGTVPIKAVAGPLSLLVFAEPLVPAAPAVAAGLLGVDLTPDGGSSPAFEATQAVGQLYVARQLSITTAGNYQVQATDVGFPAAFQNLAVIVTRGTSRVGSIFGGGSFPFPATPGDYLVNLIAQPGAATTAGTYALAAAPVPSVTLQSSATSVAPGATVTLTWTSENATACIASGGWQGSQKPAGTASSAALSADTTFTLTCSGGAGSTMAQSVSVKVTTPPRSSGGGGDLDGMLLLFLAVLVGGAVTRGLICHTRVMPCTYLLTPVNTSAPLTSRCHFGLIYRGAL